MTSADIQNSCTSSAQPSVASSGSKLTKRQAAVLKAAIERPLYRRDFRWYAHGEGHTSRKCVRMLARQALLAIDDTKARITFAGKQALADFDRLGPAGAQPWTTNQLRVLRQNYASSNNRFVAAKVGRTIVAVRVMAHKLGLRKSSEFVRAMLAAARARPHPKARGRTVANARQIGAIRYPAHRCGLPERKVSARVWEPVHRLVWVAEHGPIPTGHVVIFRPGMRTTNIDEITIDRLELVTRAEQIRRASAMYPEELKRVMHTRSVLTRMIKRRRAKEVTCQKPSPT